MSEVLRVTESRELLALIPHQLGFAPVDSLVVIGLRPPNGRVGLIARVDLAHIADTAPALAGHLVTDGATRVVVVVYTDDANTARIAAATLTEHTGVFRLAHAGTFQVTSNAYGILDAPDTYRPLTDLESTIVAATMVSRGSAYAEQRDALGVVRASVADRVEASAAHDDWLDSAHATDRPAALTMWRETITGSRVTPTRAGRLAAALTDPTTRDAILCTFLPGGNTVADGLADGTGDEGAVAQVLGSLIDTDAGVTPNHDTNEPARALLTYIAAHVDSPAAFTLLGVLAWWEGNGATANVHLQAVDAIAPDYRLARLLADILAIGLAPGWARRNG
jgi:hypothetical protein